MGSLATRGLSFPFISHPPGTATPIPRQHLRSQLPCPFGARAQAGQPLQRPRPSLRPRTASPRPGPSPGKSRTRGSRDPGLRPFEWVRGGRRPGPRAGVTSEEGGSRAGKWAAPVAAPLVCGRALRTMATAPPAPRQPGSPGRSAHLSSHRWRRARTGTHTRGAWGRAVGARCAGAALLLPPGSRRLWACPQVLPREPRGGVCT